jgi:anti-anti-sigma regulatory factor
LPARPNNIGITYTSVINRGGSLRLLNITDKIQDLLAITKLLAVFEVFDDEQSAISGF